VWNLPFRRNPAFTGREKVLTGLAEQLGRGAAAAVTQTLQGPGGVGKTALVVEYAYRHRSRFDTVWWVRAEEPASLVGDYADLAAALDLPEAGQADQRLVGLAVRRWLDGHDRWLLVLDNADSPDSATGLEAPLARQVDLLPQVPQGQVLVTSRDASWSSTPPWPSWRSSAQMRRWRSCWPARAAATRPPPPRWPSCWAGCHWRWSRPAPTCARPACR
jgi:AAA domain